MKAQEDYFKKLDVLNLQCWKDEIYIKIQQRNT